MACLVHTFLVLDRSMHYETGAVRGGSPFHIRRIIDEGDVLSTLLI